MLAPDGIKAQVGQLLGNQLTKELTGEVLTASDAYAEPPVSLTVEGKSTQTTTTGAQMLNDATSTRGYRTNPNGNPIAASSCSMSDYIPVDANTAYYFVNMLGSQSGYTLCEYDSEKAFIRNQTIYGTTSAVGTRTTSETTAYIIVSYLTANAGTAMVSKGSTATPYEPYTGGKPSPSPDYPQEITSVDAPSLELSTWNLYDLSATPTSESWAVSGSQVTHTGANVSIFAGKAPTSAEKLEHCPMLPAGTYTFSFTHVSGDTAISIYPVDDSGNRGERLVFAVASNASFTLGEATRIDIQYRNTGVESDLMLNAGSTALAYMPYKGPITTVPLYDGTLRSLPDSTKDELHLSYLRPSTREGWAWYSRELVQRVGETTTAATDGVTGTVGVDVMSTTGEIADGPTVLYKLVTPVTTTLDPIELPILPAPDATVWADPTTGLQMRYVRDTNLAYAQLEAALADLATS